MIDDVFQARLERTTKLNMTCDKSFDWIWWSKYDIHFDEKNLVHRNVAGSGEERAYIESLQIVDLKFKQTYHCKWEGIPTPLCHSWPSEIKKSLRKGMPVGTCTLEGLKMRLRSVLFSGRLLLRCLLGGSSQLGPVVRITPMYFSHEVRPFGKGSHNPMFTGRKTITMVTNHWT